MGTVLQTLARWRREPIDWPLVLAFVSVELLIACAVGYYIDADVRTAAAVGVLAGVAAGAIETRQENRRRSGNKRWTRGA